MAAPTARDIKKSVFGGLNLQSALTNSQVAGITFEPTIGIAAARIAKLGVDIRSFRVPLKRAIQQVVIPSIQTNFQVGGRPAWEPLSDYTLKRRAADGVGGDAPLVRSGKLKRTLSYYNIWTVTSTMAILADLPEQVAYGGIQQAGYEGQGGGRRIKVKGRKPLDVLDEAIGNAAPSQVVPPIPARPFVMLQPEDEDKITEIFIEWLGERVVAAWPGVRL